MKLLRINNECVPLNIKNLILDIDNVIMDSREWDKYIPTENTREGWNNYHRHHYLTTPNDEMVKFVNDLIKRGLKRIFFITAREDIYNMREVTIGHLCHAFRDVKGFHKIDKYLYMRNTCDYSPTADVKYNILHTHIIPKYYIDLAIDDDIKNVEMYRANGIIALHYDKFLDKNV